MRQRSKKKSHCFWCSTAGFTLIELVITIAIISIIAIGIFVAVDPAKRIGDSQDAQRWSDLVAIAKAVELYTADNGQLPDDFSVTDIAEGEKKVLCSSAAARTCDGQTEACLVVDDNDFLGTYLGSLPIDPSKSATTDTGYYVTRGAGDAISFGVCSAYAAAGIEMKSQVSMLALVAVCGDGDVEGDEVCDDDNDYDEGCGNGIKEDAGSYCNSTCTATITIDDNEGCDYYTWTNDCETILEGHYATENDTGSYFCQPTCTIYKGICQ